MKNDEGWMKKNEEWMMSDEWWWFQAVEGFCFLTDRLTDIGECRVAFATEKTIFITAKKCMERVNMVKMINRYRDHYLIFYSFVCWYFAPLVTLWQTLVKQTIVPVFLSSSVTKLQFL